MQDTEGPPISISPGSFKSTRYSTINGWVSALIQKTVTRIGRKAGVKLAMLAAKTGVPTTNIVLEQNNVR